jgi:hypothetical protein
MGYNIVVKHWVRGNKKPVVEDVATFRDEYDATPYAIWLANNVHLQGPMGDRVEVLITDGAGVVRWASSKIRVRG